MIEKNVKPKDAILFPCDARLQGLFEQLVHLTQRTHCIMLLTGTTETTRRIKAAVDAVLGGSTGRPRGNPMGSESDSFLSCPEDRADVTYLLNLHTTMGTAAVGNTAGPFRIADDLEKKINTYLKYRADLYESKQPRVSFEAFNVYVQSLKDGQIVMRGCSVCNSRFVIPSSKLEKVGCCVCERVLGGNVKKANAMFSELLARRATRAEKPRVSSVSP